ncbi:MAG: hypothetical protein ACKVX7_18670 [Planctomycetota bacterium]
MTNNRLSLGVVVALLFVGVARVDAGSHAWQVNELFSNADGTVQFIELKECCGFASEIGLAGKWVMSNSTGNQFFFPINLTPGTTANQHLLLATAAFAALPGAPTPDYIIESNFFSNESDTITYWMYPAATMSFASGALPLDGIHSLLRTGAVIVNSPTNFADVTGSVDASGGGAPQQFIRADSNGDGALDVADPISVLGVLFSGGATTCNKALDANDDGAVNIADPIYILSHLFSLGPAPGAPYPGCGDDPTTDTLTCDAVSGCP